MPRVYDFGKDHPYAPLIHDLLKTMTVMLVIELVQYFFLKDPLLDKVFVRLMLYTLAGYFVFYLVVDRVIGAGARCCPVPFIDRVEVPEKKE